MKSGILITFEGTEGAGKSTLIREIENSLKHLNKKLAKKVVVTREPGGSPVAEKIRELILKHPMDPWTELFLYEAARAEHLAQTIKPALEAGKIVLCDRFTDSSLAYQAHARGLPWKKTRTLNLIATQGLVPALTVFIDVDPAAGLKRATDRNRFEEEGVEFQTKVRRGFLKIKKEEPKRFMTVQAYAASPEIMAAPIVIEILKRWKRSGR